MKRTVFALATLLSLLLLMVATSGKASVNEEAVFCASDNPHVGSLYDLDGICELDEPCGQEILQDLTSKIFENSEDFWANYSLAQLSLENTGSLYQSRLFYSVINQSGRSRLFGAIVDPDPERTLELLEGISDPELSGLVSLQKARVLVGGRWQGERRDAVWAKYGKPMDHVLAYHALCPQDPFSLLEFYAGGWGWIRKDPFWKELATPETVAIAVANGANELQLFGSGLWQLAAINPALASEEWKALIDEKSRSEPVRLAIRASASILIKNALPKDDPRREKIDAEVRAYQDQNISRFLCGPTYAFTHSADSTLRVRWEEAFGGKGIRSIGLTSEGVEAFWANVQRFEKCSTDGYWRSSRENALVRLLYDHEISTRKFARECGALLATWRSGPRHSYRYPVDCVRGFLMRGRFQEVRAMLKEYQVSTKLGGMNTWRATFAKITPERVPIERANDLAEQAELEAMLALADSGSSRREHVQRAKEYGEEALRIGVIDWVRGPVSTAFGVVAKFCVGQDCDALRRLAKALHEDELIDYFGLGLESFPRTPYDIDEAGWLARGGSQEGWARWRHALSFEEFTFERPTGLPSLNLTLPRLDGQGDPIVLKGRGHVLNLWAHWCPPCRMEMPFVIELQKALEREGIDLYLVATDGAVGKEQEFIGKFPLADPARTLHDSGGFWEDFISSNPRLTVGWPQTWVVDQDGQVLGITWSFQPDQPVGPVVEAIKKLLGIR